MEHTMNLYAYLNFDGNCAEAFTFYAELLGGTIEIMQTHADSPMAEHVPADWGNKILHARMTVADTVLMASDAGDRYEKPQGFAISLSLASAEEAERVFKGLAEGGTVQMDLQETFWAVRFGMLVDRFGIPWMINCDKAA
jgi:PhnB protein